MKTIRTKADLAWLLRVADHDGTGVLIVGCYGAGKTMLARRLAARVAMPDVYGEGERTELAWLFYGAGLDVDRALRRAPFRAPHHTCSEAALCGYVGCHVAPGEVSLAHRGTLFLDEVEEFAPRVLRQVARCLRDGAATVGRSGDTCALPAQPRLVVAAAAPCPCGYLGNEIWPCTCTPERIAAHQKRVLATADTLGLGIHVRLDLNDEALAALGHYPVSY